MRNFEYITEKAKRPAKTWSNVDRLWFEYRNPNGIYERCKTLNAEVDKLVEEGLCKSGAIWVHGGLADVSSDLAKELQTLIRKFPKRVTDKQLWSALWWYRDHAERTEKFITKTRGNNND